MNQTGFWDKSSKTRTVVLKSVYMAGLCKVICQLRIKFVGSTKDIQYAQTRTDYRYNR
jgi:hypothetical protein